MPTNSTPDLRPRDDAATVVDAIADFIHRSRRVRTGTTQTLSDLSCFESVRIEQELADIISVKFTVRGLDSFDVVGSASDATVETYRTHPPQLHEISPQHLQFVEEFSESIESLTETTVDGIRCTVSRPDQDFAVFHVRLWE